MTRTCTYCGYVNTTADESSVICPNCGMAYVAVGDETDPMPTVSLDPTHASPFTVPSGGYITPPPLVTNIPSGTAPRSPAPPSNRRNLLLGLVAGIVLVALLGGGAVVFAGHFTGSAVAASATATPTVTPATTQAQMYIDPQGQFTIKYPAAWDVTTRAFAYNGGTVNATRFAAKKGGEGLVVAVSTHALSYKDTDVFISQQGGTGYATTSGPTTITAKNGTWQNVDGTFTYKGVAAALFARSTQQSGLNYLVIGYGSAVQFSGALRKVLNAIFASLSLNAGA